MRLRSALRGGRAVSPQRLWRLSSWLHHHGMKRLGRFVKRISSLIYQNSLAPDVVVPPDISFGHSCFGTVIHSNVTIGRDVRISHHVTIAVHAATGAEQGIVIEDGVRIGAHAIVLAPRGRSLRIGSGARIGAGALVVHDVPPGATVVSEPSRMRLPGEGDPDEDPTQDIGEAREGPESPAARGS